MCRLIGPGDNVRCYYCDGGLKNWQATDEPFKEHKRLFPYCPHLKERQNVPHTPMQVRLLAIIITLPPAQALESVCAVHL